MQDSCTILKKLVRLARIVQETLFLAQFWQVLQVSCKKGEVFSARSLHRMCKYLQDIFRWVGTEKQWGSKWEECRCNQGDQDEVYYCGITKVGIYVKTVLYYYMVLECEENNIKLKLCGSLKTPNLLILCVVRCWEWCIFQRKMV